MQKTNEGLCAVCGNAANQRCSQCQITYYCNREHQKSDWKKHSKICRACKLIENAEFGRHYVATRDIKIGEIVLHDKGPLVTSPDYPENIIFGVIPVSHTIPVCLNCYVCLTSDNVKPCRICGWPLCKKCDKHGKECEFTVKYGKSKIKITRYNQHEPIYDAIGILRGLALKDTDPEAYKKLLNLENHCDKILNDSNLLMRIKGIVQLVKELFDIKHIEEADIVKIFGIFRINAHQVPTTDPWHAGVYEASSYIEHSCRANCSKSYTDEAGLIVWAAVPISKGDHITICYPNFLYGTIERRSYLATTKFFSCQCERCKDPTEFGTMFNALKCFKRECDGHMLPPTFFFTRKNYPDFICSKCRATVPWKLVHRTNTIIHKDSQSMNKKDIKQCENFIAKWKKVLHENNFYMVDVEIEMAFDIGIRGSDIAERSDKCLTDLVRLCKKLTKLLQTLAPAENRTRGILLWILFRAKDVLFTRNQPEKLDDQVEFVKEGKKLLDAIHQLLYHEPACFHVEHTIAKYAWEEIIKIETTVETLHKLMFRAV